MLKKNNCRNVKDKLLLFIILWNFKDHTLTKSDTYFKILIKQNQVQQFYNMSVGILS